MNRSHTGRCRDCGRPILFARLPSGRTMPIDRGTRPDGNVAAGEDVLGQLVARVLAADAAPLAWEHRTVHHAVTCPARQPRHSTPRPRQPDLFEQDPG